MRVGGVLLLVAGFTVCGAPRVASAQGPVGLRPGHGLFGGGFGQTEHRVVFNGQFGAGLDHLDLPLSINPVEPGAAGPVPAATFGHWSGGLSYDVNRNRFSLSSSATTAARYFPSFSEPLVATYAGGVSGSLDVTSRAVLQGRYNVSYAPLSILSILPGMGEADGAALLPVDYGLGEGAASYRSQNGAVSLSYAVTSRTSITGDYAFGRAQFASTEDGAQWYSGWSSRISHSIAQGLSLRLGYRLREAVYEGVGGAALPGTTRTIKQHELDAGVDFDRAISLTRRTTLAFGTGTAMVTEEGYRAFSVVGSATLSRQTGRTWRTALSYSRDVGFIEVLREPSFADSLSLSVGGQAGRRVGLQVSAGLSQGEVGLGDSTNDYRAYRAGASATYAMTSNLALRADYSVYQYRFANQDALPDGFAGTRVRRQSVRVGLDVTTALYHRARRP